MFNIASLMQNLVAKKFQDKLGGIEDGMDMGASLLDDPSQIGGMIKDRVMNSPLVAAGRMTPEEYEEYMRNQILTQAQGPGMQPMPQLTFPSQPMSTPPYAGNQPGYLNSAQQNLGGPYGF